MPENYDESVLPKPDNNQDIEATTTPAAAGRRRRSKQAATTADDELTPPLLSLPPHSQEKKPPVKSLPYGYHAQNSVTVYVRRSSAGLGLRLRNNEDYVEVVGFTPLLFVNNPTFVNPFGDGESKEAEDSSNNNTSAANTLDTREQMAPASVEVIEDEKMNSDEHDDSVDAGNNNNATAPADVAQATPMTIQANVTENATSAELTSPTLQPPASALLRTKVPNPVHVGDLMLAVNNVDAQTRSFDEVRFTKELSFQFYNLCVLFRRWWQH